MRSAFLSALIGLAFLADGARAGVVEQFQAADWSGMAYADDQTGRLANCSVFAQYRNGVTLYFFKNVDGSWILGFDNQEWSLNPGDQQRISYQVDRSPATNADASAFNQTLLGVFLTEDDPLISQVRGGNQLIADLLGTQYEFELSNSNQALGAAEQCVTRHLAAGSVSEPAADAGASPPEAEGSPASPEAEVAQQDTQSAEPEAPAAAEDSTAGGEASTMGERQEFGPWVVAATDDGAGNFVNCTAFGVHGDDQLILSHYPGERWEFGLYRGAWALDTNQTYYLWYNIDAPADGSGVVKRPVEAAEPNRIFFEVSELEDIIARMERGGTLNVQLRGFSMEPESFSYPLDRAAEAFSAARECTRRHTEPAAADAGGPPAQEPPATSAGAEAPTATALPPIGDEQIEEFDVPGWQAGAYADGGIFTHCAIRAQYDNGTTLGVARTVDGSLLLALDRSDWSLPAGTLAAVVTIGDAAPAARSGQAMGETMAVIELGADAATTSNLAGASTLVVEVVGRTLDFDISDIGPGIAAIGACTERHRQPAAESDEAAAQQSDAASTAKGKAAAPGDEAGAAAPTGEAESAALKAEAAGYTTALLIRSGYPGHVMLTGEDIPENMRNRHAAWQIGEVMGMSDIVEGSVEDIKAQVGQSDTADCAGTLTTGTKAEDEAGRAHFFSLCDGADTDLAVHYVIIPRPDGGSYMLSLIGLGDGAAAEAIAEKVFRTASAS